MLVMYPAGDEEDVEFVITHKGSQKWEAKLLQTLDAWNVEKYLTLIFYFLIEQFVKFSVDEIWGAHSSHKDLWTIEP